MNSIESARLLLRCPETGDQTTLERVFCDPLMMHYLGGLWTPELVAGAIEEWRGEWGVTGRWSGVLVKKDTGEIVGTAGLTENTLPDDPGFELSWFILPEHQRQGFATEITAELLRFAFTKLGAQCVVAETHPKNPASNGLLKKLGFTCLGERHHAYDDLPEFETQVFWAITHNDWRT
jgi:RimJ/RimL family protein N-acetyltransferase